MEAVIRAAKESDMEEILRYINEYRLDYENPSCEEFCVAEVNGELAGFGRIKQYGGICELASLGVAEKFRRNGIGEKIVSALTDKAPSEDIHIATLIPEYFERLGFIKDDNVPDKILSKCRRVCGKVNINSHRACFMRYKKQNT